MAKIQISTKQKEFLQSKSPVVLYLAGIGSGKSFVASEKACQQLAIGAHTIVMAQSYKTLKLVMFAEILQRLRDHGIACTYYKADMVIEVEETGGKIMGFSMDSVENMRGVTVDNAILDEAALYDRYTYEVLCGRLRRGKFPYQIWLTTTPRGKNWVYDLHLQESTHFIHATTRDNPFLPPEYLKRIYAEYSGEFADQELGASFLDANADAQLIPLVVIRHASERTIIIDTSEPIVGALDVARYGKDKSVLIIRRGHEILLTRKWQGLSAPNLERVVIEALLPFEIEALVVDGCGLGGPIVDHLKEALEVVCPVMDFNGANNASKPKKYANSRTESWCLMAEWLKVGKIPNFDDYSDCTEIEYFIDSQGRKALVSKEVLRIRNKRSPDVPDALAMTLIDIRALSHKNEQKLIDALLGGNRRGRGFMG